VCLFASGRREHCADGYHQIYWIHADRPFGTIYQTETAAVV
jgi:hypothetical protein